MVTFLFTIIFVQVISFVSLYTLCLRSVQRYFPFTARVWRYTVAVRMLIKRIPIGPTNGTYQFESLFTSLSVYLPIQFSKSEKHNTISNHMEYNDKYHSSLATRAVSLQMHLLCPISFGPCVRMYCMRVCLCCWPAVAGVNTKTLILSIRSELFCYFNLVFCNEHRVILFTQSSRHVSYWRWNTPSWRGCEVVGSKVPNSL